MDMARPFSGPVSVTIAGLTLVALAAGSFAASLWRQLEQPRPDASAKVVVIAPTEPPVATTTLALATPAAQAPAKAAPAPRPVRAAPDVETPMQPIEPALAPNVDTAVDAAATGDTQREPSPESKPEVVPPY
jgi:hypothetical protein